MTFDDLFGTMPFSNTTEKTRFSIMYDNYMSDIPANFSNNQFDLAKKYEGTDFEDWVRFLKHPAFDKWKAEQIAIIASTQTDQALAGGNFTDKDAVAVLKVRQEVLNSEKNVEKPTIIVIPESLFFTDPDTGK